jgi:hypothetical protein
MLPRGRRAQQEFDFHLPPKSQWAAAAALIGWIEYSSRSEEPPPSCKRCGGLAEMRFCPSNRGVSFQCTDCLQQVGHWIRHAELSDIDFDKLPRWEAR